MNTTERYPLNHIKISKSHIQHNVKVLSDHIGGLEKCCAVIKGDAYGHWLDHVAPMLKSCGISRMAVFHPKEALRLRDLVGDEVQIFMLGFADTHDYAVLAQFKIECLLQDLVRLEEIERSIPDGVSLKLHIKVDTGMHRYGLEPDEVVDAARIIKTSNKMELSGIASHFANSWNIDDLSFARKQIKVFEKAVTEVEEVAGKRILRHIGNTAAAMTLPESYFDFLRFGIAIYGYLPNKNVNDAYGQELNLKPVLSMHSEVIAVKDLNPGEQAGYDLAFTAERPTKMALAPMGYSDGFPFAHSGKGAFVLIKGQRVPLIGRVNMNTVHLDVTDVPDVKLGDSITLLGEDGGNQVTVWDWMEWGTPHLYESLTKMNKDVHRVVVE